VKPGGDVILVAAARTYLPLLALFALSLIVARAPNAGVGFIAGLGFAMVLTLHALTFGVGASRVAFPPSVARFVLALGLISVVAAIGAPGLVYADRLAEAGAFAATVAASALIIVALFGRAPTLRDGDD